MRYTMTVILCIVVFLFSGGCTTYRIYVEAESFSPEKELRPFFTNEAIARINKATFLKLPLADFQKIQMVAGPGSENSVGQTRLLDDGRCVVLLPTHPALERSANFFPEVLIHECLHVAWHLIMSKERHQQWEEVYQRNRKEIEHFFSGGLGQDVLNSPVEVFAYLATRFILLKTHGVKVQGEYRAPQLSKEVLDQYRGILLDSFLDEPL